MFNARFSCVLLAVLGIILFGDTRVTSLPAAAKAPSFARHDAHAVRFEENVGQVGGSARFVARQRGATLLLGDDGATLAVGSASVAMKVAGARPTEPVGSDPLLVKTHYLVGDRADWHTNVASFARVTYPSVLAGVDLVFHGEDGQVEYDLVVAPGVDASKVSLELEGADALHVNAAGDLVVSTPGGDLVQARPRVFQGEHVVPASYRLAGPKAIAFAVGDYDRTKPLVIDPIVVFATYLGVGGLDTAQSLAVDDMGNTFVAGYSALSTANGGLAGATYLGPVPATSESTDMYVAKLTPTGALSFISYIGGSSSDEASGIALTSTGRPVIVGYTASSNMPIAGTPFRGTRGGGQTDGYVAELNSTGVNILFSSYIDLACTGAGCTPHNDVANAVAVTGTTVVVAGSTVALNPTTMTTALDGAYVLAFDLAAPASPSYVKYLGGGAGAAGRGIAVNASLDAFVVGQANVGAMTNSTSLVTQSAIDATPGTGTSGNAFLTKLNGIGGIQYATYLRGSASNTNDTAEGVTIDSAGKAYVVGTTSSADFRTAGAYQAAPGGGFSDAFVAKVDPAATGTASLVFSTYLGGTDEDGGIGIALAADGTVLVAGYTRSTDFPTKPTSTLSGVQDAFVAQLGVGGSTLLASSYYGGTGEEGGHGIAAKLGDVFVCGFTSSTAGLPVKSAAQGTYGGGFFDAFVGRVTLILPTPTITTPTGTETPPRGSLTFTGAGTTAPYTFDLSVKLSGGSISPAGAYKAGDTGDVTDIVRVTDGNGSTKTIEVKVGPAMKVAPASPKVMPGGTLAFTATGGKGPPYKWSVTQVGTISADGVLTAPNTDGLVVVRADDELGNFASTQVTVKADTTPSVLTLSPPSAKTYPRGKITFTVTGGTPPYAWDTDKSYGATIVANGASADYTASTVGPENDRVSVSDSAKHYVSAAVSVGDRLVINPESADVGIGGTVNIRLEGGSGMYALSFATNASGGKISADNVYTAGGTPGDDTVKVIDTAGSEATAVFHVKAGGPAVGVQTGEAKQEAAGACCSVAPGASTGSPWALPGFAAALLAFVFRRFRKRSA